MKTLHPLVITFTFVFIFLGTHPAFAQNNQYSFQIWPANTLEATGYWDTIQGKICPMPTPDQNTQVSTKVFFGLPPWAAQQAGTPQFVRETTSLPSCDKAVNITSIRPNFTGTYPVYAVFRWTQNGTVHTVQSSNTQFEAEQICPTAYGLNMTKIWYHPKDHIVFDVKSPVIDCLHIPSTVWLAIYNGSEGQETNMLYQNSANIVNESWFNYTVPEWTDKNGIFHFTAQLSWPDKDGPDKSNNYTFNSVDVRKTISRPYNMTMWVDPSSTVLGWYTNAVTKICPFGPQTDEGRQERRDPVTGLIVDPGSDILLNYHLTLPDGSQKLIQRTTIGPNISCNTGWDSTDIQANMTGTWSVYVTAQWMENGTMHTLQNPPANFEVRKPLFQSNNVQELNTTGIVAISHIPACNPELDGCQKPQFDVLDWSRDGKSLLLEYNDYKKPESSQLQLALMNLESNQTTAVSLNQDTGVNQHLSDAKFLPDGKYIYYVLDGNLYLYNLGNKTYTQLTESGGISKIQVLGNGDLAYSQRATNDGMYHLWLASPKGTKIKDLFQAQNFRSFDLSPDGKRVALTELFSGGCEYCAYTEAKVVDLDTKQEKEIPFHIVTVDGKWSPAGDLIVWHNEAGGEAPGGWLTITDQTGGFQEHLYYGHDDPTSFVISPDGSSIIYGLDYWSCCAASQGLYKLQLAKAIPEFPLGIPILIASMVSLITLYRMRPRK